MCFNVNNPLSLFSSLLRPSHISDIDHNWVAYTWAVECGFPHLSQTLYNGMVNGKVLNSLTKEDLKKFFKVRILTEDPSVLVCRYERERQRGWIRWKC